jgi:hypothetical protein
MADRALSIFSPADAARRAWIGLLGPWAKTWLVDRDRRVALTLGAAVVSSLVLASLFPIALLAIGPLALGVPHLFADVRYLVAREGLHRRKELWLAVAAPLVMVGVTSDTRWGWGAVIGAVVCARGSLVRRSALAALACGFIWLSTRFGYAVTLFLAHFHNVFALFVLWIWRPKERRLLSLAPFALFAAASAFVMLGGYEPLLAWTEGDFSKVLHLDIDGQARIFAPAGMGVFAPRLVVFFAFAQSVHYGVWLRALPDEARRSKTPRSFAQSARAIRVDLGLPIAGIAIALSIALAIFAARDLLTARDTYFRFALFHGYLEFAAFALFFSEGSLARARDPEPLALPAPVS